MKTTTRREQNYRRNQLAPKRHTRRGLFVESLENRALMAVDISIADATIKEQGNLSTFVSGNNAIHRNPVGISFGPDRNGDSSQDLYVIGGGKYGSNNIVVYDGNTGALVEEYVPAGAGLYQPGFITFDAQGNLYTAIAPPSGGARPTIMRVDHATKAYATIFRICLEK